jgi:23S rRNA (pseudouridine1915-N3)-methyltransferase
MIQVFAIGKKHEAWVIGGIRRYETRLKKPFDVEWHLLPHSALEGVRAREEESGRLLKRLSSDDFVVLLDERGEMRDSPSLSRMLVTELDHSRRVIIIIGGAYGVDEQVQKRADKILSLSKLVFPHQLVRLILVEQLYRAQEIASSRPYHHD